MVGLCTIEKHVAICKEVSDQSIKYIYHLQYVYPYHPKQIMLHPGKYHTK
jgi:hypothetical protein